MNKIIRLEATAKNFNIEELEAIAKAEDTYFCAAMSDSYDCTLREQAGAFDRLKKVIPNLEQFCPSFYGNEVSVLILSVPMTNEEIEAERCKEFETMEYNTGYIYDINSEDADFAIKYAKAHSDTHMIEYQFNLYVRISKIKGE